jgi:2-polyprenyl-3-methyl-5-hydroxy-6-metoxy-1,4-benzoquinol methylase
MKNADLALKFKRYNELSGFEKFIFKTCCYVNSNIENKTPRTDDEADFVKMKDKTLRTYKTFLGSDFFKMIPGKKVLDFGCGYGHYVVGLATVENCEVDGIDIINRCAKAERIIESHNLKNARLLTGDSRQLLKDSTYDVVISYDSFEHFEHPKAILEEMARITKPGGKILIKFGPTWMSPWGRHMGGTFRKDRPWLHLIIPEKNMMRIHSAFNNRQELYEKYNDLVGGLNKMTIRKAIKTIKSMGNIKIDKITLFPLYGVNLFKYVPFFKELLCTGIRFECSKQ